MISKNSNPNTTFVLSNKINLGVGASSIIGFNFLLEKECDVLVKIDADGQMNPLLIPLLIEPLISNKSDAAKGNRFNSLDSIMTMPKIRIIGNLGLSFLN